MAQHVWMHCRHQERLQTEMEQPWSGPVIETRVGKEEGSVSPSSNMTVGKNPRSSEAKRACGVQRLACNRVDIWVKGMKQWYREGCSCSFPLQLLLPSMSCHIWKRTYSGFYHIGGLLLQITCSSFQIWSFGARNFCICIPSGMLRF